MFIFKLFTLNNILFYFTYAIMFIFLFFMAYKYLYLEQSVYLLSNKINKLEIELNNPSINNNNSIPTSSNSALESAEIIMNEIFNDNFCSTNSCPFNPTPSKVSINTPSSVSFSTSTPSPPSTTPSTTPSTSNNINNRHEEIQEDTVQIVNEIFDLKKEQSSLNDDKESIISSNIGGGHATKKALMKLSMDKLKAKCEERKLSTEGTKNQLADKIIVHDNTVEISDIKDNNDV